MLGCHLTLVARVEAVDARILVVAVEDANASEERERPGRHGARRQEIRPYRPTAEGRRQEVALLLDAVGRDRSHLAQHVLASVVDAGAAAHDGLAHPAPRPRQSRIAAETGSTGSGSAVRRKPRIAEERGEGGRRWIDRVGHRLRVPAQAVVQGQTVPGLPAVLHEERDLVVVDVGGASLVARDAVGAAALQVEEQRAAGRGRPCRTARGSGHVAAVRAADGVRSEPARRRGRCVAQEPVDAVEQVPALEEAAKDLIVVRVQPLAAGLDRVLAGDDREVVLELKALDQLVDVGRQEERVAESERRGRTRCRCRRESTTGWRSAADSRASR